jgi:O-antigen/teichoic acid export membrane protein
MPDEPITAPAPAPPEVSRLRRWAGRLTAFFVGQGLVQVLNLATGFLLVRWLTVNDYAVYSLVTGFQGSVGVLVELGLGSSLVALLAGRTDPHVVGGYIRSTRHYRNRFFLILLPVIVVAFPVLTFRQGWGMPLTAGLLAAILVSLYYQSWASYYAVPLLIHQDLALYYRTPSFLGAARLAVSLVLHFAALLTAMVSVWLSALSTVAQGWFYRRHAAPHIVEPGESDPVKNREVLRYIRPLMPSTIFFAIQGQISILLITWFGKEHSIAEVGALGRIGQLFVMLGAFNSVIIAPAIARVSRLLLLRRYSQVLAGALLISAVLIGSALAFPDAYLWLLGHKYEHLRGELAWMMVSSCIGYLTGVLWTMHSARKWIFTWGVWTYIGSVVLTQIAGLVFMDLSTTRNVILFSVFSSLATLLVQVAWGISGFATRAESRTEHSHTHRK